MSEPIYVEPHVANWLDHQDFYHEQPGAYTIEWLELKNETDPSDDDQEVLMDFGCSKYDYKRPVKQNDHSPNHAAIETRT